MAGTSSSNQDYLRSLLSIPQIYGARVSNRRDKIGILSNATGRFELYSLPLGGSGLIQLSHGELERTPTPVIVWNTDDQDVVLSRDHEGDELHDLYRFRLGSSEVEQLTHDRTCQRYPWEFSPDGRWLLFVSDKGVEGEARKLDFWRLRVEAGAASRLTHHAQPIFPFPSRNAFRPDGKKIAYGASDTDDLNDVGVYVADSDGSRPELVYSVKKGSREVPVSWSPDGKKLAISSDAFDRLRAGILDMETREVRWMASGEYDEVSLEFSPDGRRLLARRTMGLRLALAVYDLAKDRVRTSPFQMSYKGEAGFTSDERWVVAVSDGSNQPNEIVRWNFETDEVQVLWSPRLGGVARDSLVAGRIVRYPTYDGRAIEALLVAPGSWREVSDFRPSSTSTAALHGSGLTSSTRWFSSWSPGDSWCFSPTSGAARATGRRFAT